MDGSDIAADVGMAMFMRRKAEHAPNRISGKRIRIGGVSYGIAAEMEDPVGWVWMLPETMEGTRSPRPASRCRRYQARLRAAPT